MAPRPAKRRRTATSPSPDPLNDNADYDDADEPSASHLVSFLTGYHDHHSSGSSSEGEGEGDGFEQPSDVEEEDDDEDVDLDEDDDGATEGRSTPTMKRGKMGLVGTATPRSGKSGASRRGSKTPGDSTPRRTPKRKTALQDYEDAQAQAQAAGGIIRPSKADAYFLLASRPSRTSGNSYSLLAQPLSQKSYDTYTAQSSSSRSKLGPPDSFEERYNQWLAELEAGFGLLFYGFGSKRLAINRFVQKRLAREGHCVVINGHFPQLGIRDVLSQIEDTLGVPQDIPVPNNCTTPVDRSAHRIYAYFLPPESIPSTSNKKKDQHSQFSALAKSPLYLVLHNIDSPSLRSPRSLAILSLLASSPRIRILATYDHLHTALIFSSTLTNSPPHTYAPGEWKGIPPPSRGFNWLHHNLTTYAPYTLELSYLRLSASNNSLSLSSATGTGGGISEEGALQILKSVPPMAARLLKLLLTRQLANLPPSPIHHTAHPAAQIAPVFAVDNDVLQGMAKDKFVAREPERYESLLGEYRDHGLVVEAGFDGEGRTGRWVWVPLGKAAVERVLETMKEVEV
ncbi:hypothetical protein CI109_106945 [Kwoniella shandongensis]|uniref:Origin recognition complex subunit 2 n=1 Tax=Kwoniella shandongensis TaxID=1734106 RepID=A0A5M6C706_9TREE|nr:uncharacterized protein CI109_000801 [Kwoniella shandongensis]KAA5530621.1 hypothetical protein CI109_000801 [Kwoniella shandongensis]